MREQATRCRGERRGVAASWFGGNDSASEHALKWGSVVEARVGVDVNVVKRFWSAVKESFPEWRKRKWGCG